MYIKTIWQNDVTDVDATNMNHIEDGVEKAYGVELLAVVDTAPSECSVGDKYFNTTTNKIYEATATDTWDTEGYDAESGVFYVVFSERAIYTYNGTTLVGVGSSGAGGESIPVGSIIAFAGSTAPEGYLMCDGSNVSRTTYGELFDVLGTTYGQGDTTTTFGLPNIKGRVLVGLDTSQTEFDTLGQTGGSKYLQEHTHSIKFSDGGATGSGGYITTSSSLSYITSTQSINSAGTGDSGNLQPYIVVNYIIKAHHSAVNTSEVVNEHSTSETDVYSCNYVNEALDEKQDNYELINVNSGTGDITLSKSATNYTMIEVFGSKSGCFGSTKIYNPNGKTFGLAIHNAYSGNAIQQLFANYTISGTTITKNREVYMNDNSAPAQSNDVVIDYVVGYK